MAADTALEKLPLDEASEELQLLFAYSNSECSFSAPPPKHCNEDVRVVLLAAMVTVAMVRVGNIGRIGRPHANITMVIVFQFINSQNHSPLYLQPSSVNEILVLHCLAKKSYHRSIS
eukprot:6009342-Amphidinium_carterae.1